jgi:hypothetical protein
MKTLSQPEITQLILRASGPFSCYHSSEYTHFARVRMQCVFARMPDGGIRYAVTLCEDARGEQQAAQELKRWERDNRRHFLN